MSDAAKYPSTRMRRLRTDKFSRALVSETHLSKQDFIYPMFIIDGENSTDPIASMPGLQRLTIDRALEQAAALHQRGLCAVALFPVVPTHQKSLRAEEAWHAEGLMQRAIRAFKRQLPELGVISDVALDPYTSHGQDGIVDERGYVINDVTCEALVKQALSHAAAGADVIAPSDMMDGRVGQIRQMLETEGFFNTKILSYAVKFASSYYGPFRDAVGSQAALKGGSKAQYQMDPANTNEALREVALDLQEGADLIMVKPALMYLDVIQRITTTFQVPVVAYQVSGEYAMLKAAAAAGWLQERAAVLEACLALKRSGATAIVSYFAESMFDWLEEGGES